jgi:GNAT superfamily N-acetyltransferase
MQAEKRQVLDILSAAFDMNKSVGYLVGDGKGRGKRIRALIDYSYERCRRYGKIYRSGDGTACALVLYPDRKRATLLLDLKLILRCTGLRRLPKILRREKLIGARHPNTPFTQLWYIGVAPGAQGKGYGTALLEQILAESAAQSRPVYLETSTELNLPFYQAAGFRIFHEADLGFPLYFLNRDFEGRE